MDYPGVYSIAAFAGSSIPLQSQSMWYNATYGLALIYSSRRRATIPLWSHEALESEFSLAHSKALDQPAMLVRFSGLSRTPERTGLLSARTGDQG